MYVRPSRRPTTPVLVAMNKELALFSTTLPYVFQSYAEQNTCSASKSRSQLRCSAPERDTHEGLQTRTEMLLCCSAQRASSVGLNSQNELQAPSRAAQSHSFKSSEPSCLHQRQHTRDVPTPREPAPPARAATMYAEQAVWTVRAVCTFAVTALRIASSPLAQLRLKLCQRHRSASERWRPCAGLCELALPSSLL